MEENIRFPSPFETNQDEYVKQRFEKMPKEIIEYFDLSDGGHVNGRAHFEVLFRAEYNFYRERAIAKITSRLYQKYKAALMVVETAKNKPIFDLDIEMSAAMEAVGVQTFIPKDF